MKASIKGVLLSGLVYPGVGQLILGRAVSGILFIVLATAGFIVLIYRMIQRCSRLIEQVLPLLADNRLNAATLKQILDADSGGGWRLETISLIVLGGSWLAAMVHAYVVGRKIDRQSR